MQLLYEPHQRERAAQADAGATMSASATPHLSTERTTCSPVAPNADTHPELVRPASHGVSSSHRRALARATRARARAERADKTEHVRRGASAADSPPSTLENVMGAPAPWAACSAPPRAPRAESAAAVAGVPARYSAPRTTPTPMLGRDRHVDRRFGSLSGPDCLTSRPRRSPPTARHARSRRAPCDDR
jgi:hypothetical protein